MTTTALLPCLRVFVTRDPEPWVIQSKIHEVLWGPVSIDYQIAVIIYGNLRDTPVRIIVLQSSLASSSRLPK